MNEFLLKYFIIFFGLGPLVIFGIILILLYKYKNILPTWHFFNLIFKFEELTALIKNNYELKKTKDGNIEVNEMIDDEDELSEDEEKNKKTNVSPVIPMNFIGKLKFINVSHNILISKDLPHFYINDWNIEDFKRNTAILGFFYLYILYIMFIRLVIMESRTSEVCLDGYYCSNLPQNLTCNDLSTNTTDLDDSNKMKSNIKLYCITLKSFYDVFFIQLPLFYGTIKVLKFINIFILKFFYWLFEKLTRFLNTNAFFEIIFFSFFLFSFTFLLTIIIIEAIDDITFPDRLVEVVAWIDFCVLTVSFPAFLWNKRLLSRNNSKYFSFNIRNIAFIDKNIKMK